MRLLVPLVLVVALALATAGAAGAQAPLSREVRAEPVRDKPVGAGKKLTVFVDYAHPAKGGKPTTPSCATDSDQSQTVPHFASSAPSPFSFEINASTFPSSVVAGADGALRAGFGAWDREAAADYFAVETTTSAPTGPARDGTNTVGWARLRSGAGSALAAAWVWEDANGRVEQADIFFNTRYPWGVFTSCPAGNGTYEVGNVAAHEIGHTLGLDHLSDPGRQATLYPSAPRNEVIKRTLTRGDRSGFRAALGL